MTEIWYSKDISLLTLSWNYICFEQLMNLHMDVILKD